MATLQVRDMDDRLYNHLKARAKREKRSISQEVVAIIEDHLASPGKKFRDATEEFLDLTGAWKDTRDAGEIVRDLRGTRRNSRRFEKTDGLFD